MKIIIQLGESYKKVILKVIKKLQSYTLGIPIWTAGRKLHKSYTLQKLPKSYTLGIPSIWTAGRKLHKSYTLQKLSKSYTLVILM